MIATSKIKSTLITYKVKKKIMNNLDQASAGVELELNVSYDSDQASRDFEEAFHVLQYSGYKQNSVLVFNQYGNFDLDDFDFTDLENWDLKSATNSTILDYIRCGFYRSSEDMKDDTLNFFSKYPYQLTKGEMLEFAENIYCSEDYLEFLEENFTPTFIKLESRGYSQGDYSEVIIPKIVIDSYEGKTFKEVEKIFSDKEIDQLLWDQPIYARLTIGKEDSDQFDFMEFAKDSYNYDKEEFLAIAKEHISHEKKAVIIGFLEENLPDQPDYD